MSLLPGPVEAQDEGVVLGDIDTLDAVGAGVTATKSGKKLTLTVPAASATKLDDLAAPDDNTDLNVSTSAHGLTPKLPNDATKYLDGTGAYTVPAGGGAIDHTVVNGSTSIYKPSNETIVSSTTFQSDDDFTWDVVTGRTYLFEFSLQVAYTVNNGFKVALGGTCTIGSPGGGALTGMQYIVSASSSSVLGAGNTQVTSNDSAFVNQVTATAPNSDLHGWFFITITGSGTLTVRWAQSTSHADDTTMRQGSIARLTRKS